MLRCAPVPWQLTLRTTALRWPAWRQNAVSSSQSPCHVLSFTATSLRRHGKMLTINKSGNGWELWLSISIRELTEKILLDIENLSWAPMRNRVHPSEFAFQKSWAIANTYSQRWTPYHTGAHDWLYFFHNDFTCDNFTKTSEINLKWSKIMVRSWKSQLGVGEILILYWLNGFNSLAPGRCGSNFKNTCYKLISWAFCQIALRWMSQNTMMISQHWFSSWLGAVRQQAITWANVDPDLWHHMASLGHNELTHVSC